MIQYLCTVSAWNDSLMIRSVQVRGGGFKCSFFILIQKGIIRHVQYTLALLPVGARGNTPSDKVKQNRQSMQ